MALALSAGVRNALSSLQSNASAAQAAQLRLATGKRVNSAVDNPSNFFTAASLNDRAGQFSNLLDGMSNSIQTINAASKGIDGITKLVQSAQSTIKQALNDAAANRPNKTGTTSLSEFSAGTVDNVPGKSAKDIALDKLVEGTAAAASSTSAGSLGVVANSDVTIAAGNSTYTFKTNSTMTVRDLVNEINKSGTATASVNDAGKLTVTGSGSDTLKFGIGGSGAENTKVGLAATDFTTGVASSGSSSVRANLVDQFNDLRKQIDQLAKDAGFNGTNLLDGNKLTVTFNEKTGADQSKLDVQGSTVSADNLGIQKAGSGVDFQNDTSLKAASAALTNALGSLNSLSSTLGSSLSTVQTRQDFTKGMIDTLKTGADNLVLADQNEEGAKLLALNTRTQLSQTALQLSSQQDQAVLRLF